MWLQGWYKSRIRDNDERDNREIFLTNSTSMPTGPIESLR